MKKEYEICICSPPDREEMVAEIFFEHIQLAEINQEKGFFEIEFYSRPDGTIWCIDFTLLVNVLKEAEKLLKKSNQEN